MDPTGRLITTATLPLHGSAAATDRALADLGRLIDLHRVSLIAIGNGTASRETESLVAGLIPAREGLRYLLVSEAGASVYSASALAAAELPELDVTLRGAVSIARRVQDPLAELVKIEPKAIGVGLYQHDVDPQRLARTLDGVVEDVVNAVGVDLNTASGALLGRVAGLGPALAQRIVARRDSGGPFARRMDLMGVPGLGPKAFQQAAGFLRIADGAEPLDASAIHPERYAAARQLLALAGLPLGLRPGPEVEPAIRGLTDETDRPELGRRLGLGLPTLDDILQQLQDPARDPRAQVPPPLLRSDVLAMKDLQVGLRLHGTVRNVVDFGAFIDIGLKEEGLLHQSQLPRGQRLSVGDAVQVEVLRIEIERGRIALGWVTEPSEPVLPGGH